MFIHLEQSKRLQEEKNGKLVPVQMDFNVKTEKKTHPKFIVEQVLSMNIVKTEKKTLPKSIVDQVLGMNKMITLLSVTSNHVNLKSSYVNSMPKGTPSNTSISKSDGISGSEGTQISTSTFMTTPGLIAH